MRTIPQELKNIPKEDLSECKIKLDEMCYHLYCRRMNQGMTLLDHIEDRVTWHFDTNWGRFLSESKRKKYHGLLVRDAMERANSELRQGKEPDIDIIAAVHLGISGDKETE